MFPLQSKSLPESAAQLQETLARSLSQLVRVPPANSVTVNDDEYPKLKSIAITLDHAAASEPLPPPPVVSGPIAHAWSVEDFRIDARGLQVRNSTLDLQCRARALEIGHTTGADGNVVLVLQNVADGQIEISITLADLERLLRSMASSRASQHGVIVEDLRLTLEAKSPRALEAQVKMRARKLFLNAAVEAHGQVEIDNQMVAKLSGLDCSGEGTLGTLACNFIGPQLERFEGRQFSLLTLPLGEVQLRDVQVKVNDRLTVQAKFSSAA